MGQIVGREVCRDSVLSLTCPLEVQSGDVQGQLRVYKSVLCGEEIWTRDMNLGLSTSNWYLKPGDREEVQCCGSPSAQSCFLASKNCSPFIGPWHQPDFSTVMVVGG